MNTTHGEMTPQGIVDYLTYVNFAHNRRLSPEVTVERWEKIYGPNTRAMEEQFQKELRNQ